jgi:gamma-glutamyltranspeptidase
MFTPNVTTAISTKAVIGSSTVSVWLHYMENLTLSRLNKDDMKSQKTLTTKPKSKSTDRNARIWAQKYVENEVESGTSKKQAQLWAKEICTALLAVK